MLGKKGDKSLSMIFGLFVLLIISLVVLSLFFKFTEKSSSKLTSTGQEYFTKAAIDKAVQQCMTLCEGIENNNDAIEFCRKFVQIDFDGDNLLESKHSYGQWDFCENKVPCFVLIDKCKNSYDGAKCKTILTAYRVDAYEALANEEFPCDGDPMEGSCCMGLSGDQTTSNNWKERFDFTSS
ncbi:hypothetical protein JXA85_02770 [Candidatus Woesearchaeota archaeon]|nr:hypothetical protein [Candidatus Woesearchaeota archaeon]